MLTAMYHRITRVPYTLAVHVTKPVRKPTATVVFLHGMGNSGESWDKVRAKLPDDIKVITIDLLGFGSSAKPVWAKYDVCTQARSVIVTFIKLRLSGKVILVGHSLGALVAIEVAKRYPVVIQSLILCGPPLYDIEKDKVRIIANAFSQIQRSPDGFIRMVAIAKKYKILKPTFVVDQQNIHAYVGTLRASILTQTSLQDVCNLKKRITLIHGTLDPWVKKRNLVFVTKYNNRATLRTTKSGHEIRGLYIGTVVRSINEHLHPGIRQPASRK